MLLRKDRLDGNGLERRGMHLKNRGCFQITPIGKWIVQNLERLVRFSISNALGCGFVAAWNIEDDFVLSGWLSLRNKETQTTSVALDSMGIAFSSYAYAYVPSHRLAFQIAQSE